MSRLWQLGGKGERPPIKREPRTNFQRVSVKSSLGIHLLVFTGVSEKFVPVAKIKETPLRDIQRKRNVKE